MGNINDIISLVDIVNLHHNGDRYHTHYDYILAILLLFNGLFSIKYDILSLWRDNTYIARITNIIGNIYIYTCITRVCIYIVTWGIYHSGDCRMII